MRLYAVFKTAVLRKRNRWGMPITFILNNNVATVETEYVHGILMVVFQVFSLVFALIATTLIQPIMTVVVIALCVIPLFVPKLLKKKLEKLNREALSSKAKYLEFLNEFLEGFQTIKIFGRGCEINRYHKKINEETTNKVQFNSKWCLALLLR